MNPLEILLIYARQGDGVELIGERRKAFIRMRDKRLASDMAEWHPLFVKT